MLKYSHEDFIAVFTHGQFIAATRWLVEVAPTRIDGTSMKQFRCFLDRNRVPTGAILPMELDREEVKVRDIITSHLTPLKDERPFDKGLSFVEKACRSIYCGGSQLGPMVI